MFNVSVYYFQPIIIFRNRIYIIEIALQEEKIEHIRVFSSTLLVQSIFFYLVTTSILHFQIIN